MRFGRTWVREGGPERAHVASRGCTPPVTSATTTSSKGDGLRRGAFASIMQCTTWRPASATPERGGACPSSAPPSRPEEHPVGLETSIDGERDRESGPHHSACNVDRRSAIPSSLTWRELGPMRTKVVACAWDNSGSRHTSVPHTERRGRVGSHRSSPACADRR